MNAALILQIIGGAGFLAGIVAIAQFINTRRPTRDRSSAEAYTAYRQFVAGAFDDAAKINAGVVADRDRLNIIRSTLIDLVQDVLGLARRSGAKQDELEPFYDRLDEARAL